MMSPKKTTITTLLIFVFFCAAHAQVGIGTNDPDSSALLELNSTTRGFLPPRMDDAARDAISNPAVGLTIFNTTENCLQWFDGTDWYSACSGSLAFTPDPLPGNITLEAISPYFIASIFDQDYLPYTSPTSGAQLPGVLAADNAGGGNEASTIDVLGTLTTAGVTIKIPYTVQNASVNLPAYSQTITIPADYTHNNTATDITFEYSTQTLAVGSGTFDATLKAATANLEAIKLDLNSGLGDDFLGWLLGTFSYATNDAGGTANLEVRVTPGIPDREFGDGSHDFLYLPVADASGNLWLNNNLGASYANIDHPDFNPAQQAISETDDKAYGSLYQWGRYSEGHELANRNAGDPHSTSGTHGSQANTATPNSGAWDAKFITGFGDWIDVGNDSLWNTNDPTNANDPTPGKGATDPCPSGFRVPTEGELLAARDSWGTQNSAGAYASPLKLTLGGRRWRSNGVIDTPDIQGLYWSSNVSFAAARSLDFNTTSATFSLLNRADGHAVRCIID